MTHTLGEWTHEEDNTSPGYFYVKSGKTVVCCMQQRTSAMGMRTDPTRKECKANVKLISAAPELLEELENARGYVVYDAQRGNAFA